MLRMFAAAMALAMCGVPAQARMPAQDNGLAQMVDGLQSMIGQQFEGDLVISAIAGEEGDMLVVTIDAKSGWAGISVADATGMLLAGFCESENGGAFFNNYRLRVDRLDHGAPLDHGMPVTKCPAKPA